MGPRLLLLGPLALVLLAVWVVATAPVVRRLELPLAPLEPPASLRPVDRLPVGPGALAGRNVLLVTLDTTRPDRLGLFGNAAIRTPTLDGLAAEGIVLPDALAVAPTTLPSHASILTGLYPHRHGARTNARTELAERHVTLAEVLAQHGYATGAFVSSFVLDARFGLAQGFDEYDDRATGTTATFSEAQRRADETNARAIAWLRRVGAGPFLLWVHYMDPHADYVPPSPFAETYAANPYDGEIAYVDAQLGALLAALGTERLADTLIVVVADHGEGLGHQGEYTHGLLLHEAVLRVPLLFRLPGGAHGGLRLDAPVSQVDVLPTVLSLLGIEPPGPLDGVDLTQPPDGERPLFAETLYGRVAYGLAPLLAVRQGGLAYVHGPSPQLYDLSRDPLEAHDLYAEAPDRAAPLVEALRREHGADLARLGAMEPHRRISPDEQEKLRALGYVVGGEAAPGPAGPRLDPREMLPVLNEIVLVATATGNDPGVLARLRHWASPGAPPPTPEARLARLEAIAREHPDFVAAHAFLAQAYQRAGRLAEAESAAARAEQLAR